jgi:N-acetylglucosaminyldiphosphoundecaprenol N-acetyl-beta-D-mannosaminyltransferase
VVSPEALGTLILETRKLTDSDTTNLSGKRMLAGILIRRSTPEAAARELITVAQTVSNRGRGVHLVNAYTLSLAHTDQRYAEMLRGAWANFPDGKPLAWVTRFSRHPLNQVRGPQLFQDVLDAGRDRSLKHFLLGGSEDTLSRLTDALTRKHPGIEIVGTYSPPFRAQTIEEQTIQDALIASSGAQVVWVGLGTPKQDYETERLAAVLPVVACAVGAAFDFAAGTKKEAPHWMTSVGLEWLYRFATEPRRLWKRYLVGNVVFLWAVVSRRRMRS